MRGKVVTIDSEANAKAELRAAMLRLRHDLNLSQGGLARELGIHSHSVAGWEGGRYEPSRWNYWRLLQLGHKCGSETESFFEDRLSKLLGMALFREDGRNYSIIEEALTGTVKGQSPSPATRQELHTALDLILDRAPETMKAKIVEVIENAAGKYSRKR